jgi:hypothetical protein
VVVLHHKNGQLSRLTLGPAHPIGGASTRQFSATFTSRLDQSDLSNVNEWLAQFQRFPEANEPKKPKPKCPDPRSLDYQPLHPLMERAIWGDAPDYRYQRRVKRPQPPTEKKSEN